MQIKWNDVCFVMITNYMVCFYMCFLQGCFVSFHNVVSNYIDDILWFDIICIIFHSCDSFISFGMFNLSL